MADAGHLFPDSEVDPDAPDACLPVADGVDETEMRAKIGRGPPSSGMEYLAWVRMEANGLPFLMKAKAAGFDDEAEGGGVQVKVDGDTVIAAPRESGVGGAGGEDEDNVQEDVEEIWRREVLSEFADLRLQLSAWRAGNAKLVPAKLPKLSNGDAWEVLVLGRYPVGRSNDKGLGQKQRPRVSLLLRMQEVHHARILSMFEDWLLQMDEDKEEIPLSISDWLYGVLAILDKPANSDATATLRSIFTLYKAELDSRKARHGDAAIVIDLQLIMVIICRFFGQLDLERHLRA